MLAGPTRRRQRAQALLALFLVLTPLVSAQTLSNLPTLSSSGSTAPNGKSTATGTASDGTTANSARTTTNGQTTGSDESSTFLTNAPTLGSSSTSAFHLTGLPTIAGGIPTIGVPFTANSPYMRKSDLPEGTFFIAVGATLAFFGACVLLWRAMVAWSINRSVKKTAMASVGNGRSEKSSSPYGWTSSKKGSGYNAVPKNAYHRESNGSNMSLDRLTSTGKQMSKPHFRDSIVERTSSGGPQDNLFFSPTARATHRESGGFSNRPASGYMPSGFYASTAAQPAGGAQNTTIGGSLAPYAQQNKRQSTLSNMSASRDISPPSTPGGYSRGSGAAPGTGTTYRGMSRDGYGRDSYQQRQGPNQNEFYDQHPSTSSLMVGANSVSDLSRAPSAYLEDLFDNHGNGPRERF